MIWALLSFAVILVAVAPTIIFVGAYSELDARAEASLNHGADAISKYIAIHPENWRFLSEKINSVIESSGVGRRDYAYRVRDHGNAVIVERVFHPTWMSVVRATSLSDGTKSVGQFEISYSLGPVVAQTAMAGLAGLVLSWFLTYLFVYNVFQFIEAVLRQAAFDEKKMRYMEKFQSVGLLVGGVAHNFNNLLQPIKLLSEMTMNKSPEHSTVHKNMEVINHAAHQASQLVRQIMELSRQDETKKENLELRDIVERALSIVRMTAPPSITVKDRLAFARGRVVVDHAQIETVLLNMLANAIDALEGKKGDIEIAVSREDIQGTRATDIIHLESGAYMKITIADTGKGMNAETQSRIFEPFFSTKAPGKGTGLGLSTSLSIIAKHGGTIQVESAVGEGSTFHVYLPLVGENAA